MEDLGQIFKDLSVAKDIFNIENAFDILLTASICYLWLGKKVRPNLSTNWWHKKPLDMNIRKLVLNKCLHLNELHPEKWNENRLLNM